MKRSLFYNRINKSQSPNKGEDDLIGKIKTHVFRTGEVCAAPKLSSGGDDCNMIEASGVSGEKENRIWLPVSSYLIEHPKGTFLTDTDRLRDMDPNGVFDKKAQIKSLNSRLLYKINQGKVGLGRCIDEQLLKLGIKDSGFDTVLLTHLDCSHANGLKRVSNTEKFLVPADEAASAQKLTNRVRYRKTWWEGVSLTAFGQNNTQGAFSKSYDLLGDDSTELINIPGRADGLFAVEVKNDEGKSVLLFSDDGYATKSWEQMATSGVATDREKQRQSLTQIREQSLGPDRIESLANHGSGTQPHIIRF